jgi:hypothetical protein
MTLTPKNRNAIVISYFRDITAVLGIPIVVLVYRDNDEVEVHIRKDWHAVTAYDKDADLKLLQSFVSDNLPKFKRGKAELTVLLSAENNIRAEKLAGTDFDFDRKLAEAIYGF